MRAGIRDPAIAKVDRILSSATVCRTALTEAVSAAATAQGPDHGYSAKKRCSMRRKFIIATAVAVLLAACAVQAPLSPASKEQRPSGFPDDFYRRSAERDSAVFHIEPALSLVVIEARRGGSLAHLGHDHVIASHNVRGYVAPNEARADPYILLDALVFDEHELRAQAAFGPAPYHAAIAGARRDQRTQ